MFDTATIAIIQNVYIQFVCSVISVIKLFSVKSFLEFGNYCYEDILPHVKISTFELNLITCILNNGALP